MFDSVTHTSQGPKKIPKNSSRPALAGGYTFASCCENISFFGKMQVCKGESQPGMVAQNHGCAPDEIHMPCGARSEGLYVYRSPQSALPMVFA